MTDVPVRLRLVLFGEQRSGTSLLASLLDAQPGVRVAGGYLGAMMHCAYRELQLRPRDRLEPRQRHVLWQRIRASEKQSGSRAPSAMPAEVTTLDELHAYSLGLVADARDAIVGHKIHGPIEALPALLELADVRCVYLIRDARDVLLSRAHRGESALDEPAASWSQSAALAREHRREPRLFVLRFEDLIADPDSVMHRLGGWLGVSLASSNLLLADDGRPVLQNSSFGDLVTAFDRRAVERFRAHGASRIVRFAQWRCRKELSAWGYRLEAGLEPALGEWLHFHRRRVVSEALELPRRAKNALLARALPSLVRGE
jgi:hypothetical protein